MRDPGLDELFAIAEASPVLDEAEKILRAAGHNREAAALVRLQQDAGVQIDREINGFDENEPAPGPQTALLNQNYSPLTGNRLQFLDLVQDLLPAGAVKTAIGALMDNTGTERILPPRPPRSAFAP